MSYPPPQDSVSSEMARMSIHSQSAGDSPLLSMFAEGNVVILKATSTGKSLRIVNGEVEGNGAEEKESQFTVHVRGPERVALQSASNSDWWLTIFDGRTIGTGHGGPYSEFLVKEEAGSVSLESAKYPGQRIGVSPSGVVMPPTSLAAGPDSSFTCTVYSMGAPLDLPVVYPSLPPLEASSYLPPPPEQQQPPLAAPPSYTPASMDPYPPPQPQPLSGNPPPYYPTPPPAAFAPQPLPPQAQFPGPQTQFSAPQPQAQAPVVVSLQPQAKAGSTALLLLFTQGNVLQFRSASSGKYLQLGKGRVGGGGGDDVYSHFKVHVRGPGKVALEGVASPGSFLSLRFGVAGIGEERSPFSELLVKEIGGFVAFQSTHNRKFHIGVLRTGAIKPAAATTPGSAEGRFTPKLVSAAVAVAIAQPAVQVQPAVLQYTQQPQPAMQPGYPQQHQGQYPSPHPHPQPQCHQMPHGTSGSIPFGFCVTDAFKEGNVVQLISKANGNLMRVKSGSVCGDGTFSHTDSQFTVSIPSGAAPGTLVVTLRNVQWQGALVTIKGNSVTTSKGGTNCYLRVHVLPDNYVYFESTEHSGHYLGIAKNGSACKPKEVRPDNIETQFFVRVESQLHQPSQVIMTPFGKPSIINSLTDKSVIQLYIKSSGTYLSINGNGVVMYTSNAGDVHTFFILRDRGMGIVSLDSYKHTGFRLRMANFAVQGKGTSDLNADFRVKESPDGALYLESVTCPTACVGIQSEGQLKTGLSVFLMNIQKFGNTETVTKSPLN